VKVCLSKTTYNVCENGGNYQNWMCYKSKFFS
jgi:hypothetical protein